MCVIRIIGASVLLRRKIRNVPLNIQNMKKFLLGTLMAILGVLPLCAQNEVPSLTFGYCSDDIKSTISMKQMKYYLGAAIRIDASQAELFKGSKLTGVQMALGKVRQAPIATFFITKKLGDAPVYTQEISPVSNSWSTFQLNTPFEITGEEFYIGYYIFTLDSEDLPIAFDGQKASAVEGSAYFAYDSYGITQMMEKFNPVQDRYGNLCMRAIVTGENLPKEKLDLLSISAPLTTELNKDIPVTLSLANMGMSKIENFDLTVKVGDEIYDQHYDVALDKDEKKDFTLTGVKAVKDGYSVPIEVTAVKANDIVLPIRSKVSTSIMASDNLSPRVVVVEEGTGTWCKWCPRGYVGMEYMAKTYGDKDNYVGIAVHIDDEMETSSYSGGFRNLVLNTPNGGYPCAFANRKLYFDPTKETLEQVYNDMKEEKVEASMKLSWKYNDDYTRAVCDVTTTFAMNIEDANYGVSLVAVEDNVGPYWQENIFAGGGNGALEGFSDQPSPVEKIFNEVATYNNNFSGAIASVPVSIEGGKEYLFHGNVYITPKRTGDTSVVALLINRQTGEIVTAAKAHLDNSGVESAVAADARVVAENGSIKVVGEYASCQVFGLGGMKVAELDGTESVSLPKGIYIVNLDGKAVKVML